MAGKRSPVGLLGGTFDPVHLGHLRPALELLQGLGLAELRLVPGRIPPHRRPPRASPDQRLELVVRATEGVPGLAVDDCELRRDGPSYTVETLRRFRGELGAERPLCFIMGADAFLGLSSWYRWRELTEHAHLVVMTRPDSPLGDLPQPLADWLAERQVSRDGLRRSPAGGIRIEPVSPVGVSGSGIRRCMARGESARYLVPEPVWHAIAGAGIYGYPQL